MTNSKRFETLLIWQESISLAKQVFVLFEKSRVYSLKDQAERSAVSISSNIAEGYEMGTIPQFIRYLFIAKGSCGELRSQLFLAQELGLAVESHIQPMIDRCARLSVMIHKLIDDRRKIHQGK